MPFDFVFGVKLCLQEMPALIKALSKNMTGAHPLKLASISSWVYGGLYKIEIWVCIESLPTTIQNMNKNKTKLNKVLYNNNVNGKRLRKWSVIELTLFVEFRSLIRNAAMHSNKNFNIPMRIFYLTNYSKSWVPAKPI